MESQRKGEYTEAVVLTELKGRNIPVSIPFGDNERYDLVIETPGGRHLRAQVKTGWITDGVVQFKGQSQHTNANGNTYKPYTDGIDCFLIYTHEIEEMFLVWKEEVGQNMSIRISTPKQTHDSMNWAEEYQFDNQWPPKTPPVRAVSGGRSPAVMPVGNLLKHRGIPFVQTSGDVHHFLACDDTGTQHTLRACTGSVSNGRIRFPTLEPGAVDAYCVHHAGETYLIADAAFDQSFSLRVDDPDQPDATINWANEYQFDDQWPP